MAAKVVDASAAAAILFGEPDGPAVATRLAGASLAAPTLIAFELGNVCTLKCRRHPAQRDAFIAAFGAMGLLGIAEQPVDQPAVLALALATRLTQYDAAYLWLARHLGAELVSLDAALAKAAAAL